ncbi:MAG: shikimate dehydrogenase [Planctomycetaceae bacterium]|nr:shikimate dehydrogenase [Planctomycetaceae bacterium]
MTLLAVCISPKDEKDFLEQLKLAQLQGAEAIEIRTDALNDPDSETVLELIQDVRKTGLPVIVTCRDIREGGFKHVDFSCRLEILRKAILAGADYVDVELSNFRHPDVQSVIKAALGSSSTRLILSAHNFEGPFQDVQILYESILSLCPEAIPKIVSKANHLNECFAVFELLVNAETPLIAFCMGSSGQVSRILAKKLGSLFTYASIDEKNAAAAGQLSVGQLKKAYRWDSINSETEVFGLIGSPVAHSLSPALYNACFEKDHLNALYLPFLVEGDIGEFSFFLDQMRRLKRLGLGGFSVTIPHKTSALEYAKQHGEYVDPLAVTIGSVNTLKIGFNGLISAYNTDYSGAMEALSSVIGSGTHRLHQMTAAVIGAGGAARAIVAGLTEAGSSVTIYNRTFSRARRLADEFGCKAESFDAIAALKADILINCTSIGMYPQTKASPIPDGILNENMIVFDTVYNPLETELLKKAKQAGARVVNGAEMFIRQAIAQYKIFIGKEPQESVVRQIVIEGLTSKD